MIDMAHDCHHRRTCYKIIILVHCIEQAFFNVGLGNALDGMAKLFGDKLGAQNDQFGVVFAFQVLPIVIFIACLLGRPILYLLVEVTLLNLALVLLVGMNQQRSAKLKAWLASQGA